MGTTLLEDVAAAAPDPSQHMFQLYVIKDRDFTRQLVQVSQRQGQDTVRVIQARQQAVPPLRVANPICSLNQHDTVQWWSMQFDVRQTHRQPHVQSRPRSRRFARAVAQQKHRQHFGVRYPVPVLPHI